MLADRAALRFPDLPMPRASDTQGLAACYDVTEDWAPIYDKSALPGYFMAIGTSGNQFKNAGVAGRLMADLIQCSLDGRDTDAQPLSFALQRIPGSHVISSATFSRRRHLLQTSGTVLG
jgi:sarcosine oxidase, subunit beta